MNDEMVAGAMDVTLGGLNMEATGVVDRAAEALRASSEIPEDAKEAVESFVTGKINQLLKCSSDLLEFPIPEWLIDIWPTVVEILLKVF
ncbi:MAG: hypothetical protein KUG72_03840 [Pseudomonadales bacterium]|nr:hypothetical protein [Pseudomonadales bacterium]